MQICQLEGLPLSLQTHIWRWESQGFWALCMPYGNSFLDMFLTYRLGHVEVKISLRNTDGKSVAGIHQLFRKEALDQAAVSVNISYTH